MEPRTVNVESGSAHMGRDPAAKRSLHLLLALVAGALIRALHADQPIVENYIGRQTPTAMVARNLERGSGFLHPQLDTAPFPNYFLVEPPFYQAFVVGLRACSGLPLHVCGRLTSALLATLAAWGVFVLVERREGWRAALAAAAAFSMLPITLRYGRAFQPDVLMLGACTSGLACWDLATTRADNRRCLIVGWLLLALGLAAKATSAFLLPVAVLAIFRTRDWKTVLLCASTLIPALLWYAWAGHLASTSTGSRASAANHEIWMRLIGFGALATREPWTHIVRFLLLRAFTPLGLVVAIWGLWPRRDPKSDHALWWIWGGFGLMTMGLLAEKLHHEYYWLCIAPVVAAGLGCAWARADAHRPMFAFGSSLAFATLCLWFAISTWRAPDEWVDLASAGRVVTATVPVEAWLVAPEPLLYQADRRGCRLEFTARAAERAASEWGEGGVAVQTPLDLIEFYRTKGARWIADVGAAPHDARRMALHDGIRRRYKILVDRPEVLLAELISSEPSVHDN